MFSLQKMFGRDDVFFDLLEKSAEEAQESVRLTRIMLSDSKGRSASMDDFALLRKRIRRSLRKFGRS
jgi:hypothetical protein